MPGLFRAISYWMFRSHVLQAKQTRDIIGAVGRFTIDPRREETLMKSLLLTFALLLLLNQSPLSAQSGPKDGAKEAATDLDRVKVGQPAPDFTLEDSDRKNVTLADYRGKKNVVLVFYRGHW